MKERYPALIRGWVPIFFVKLCSADMIKYDIAGAIIAVNAASDNNFEQASDVSVLVDGEDMTPYFAPLLTDEGWELSIPPDLYDGLAHRIALRTIVDGEEIERTSFSFSGSGEVLDLS